MDREQILYDLKEYLKSYMKRGWSVWPQEVLEKIEELEEEYE